MSTVQRWLLLLVCIGLFGLVGMTLGRKHTFPDRLEFSIFPNTIAGWTGRPVKIRNTTLRQLRLTDHLSRRYRRGEEQVHIYVGFHGSQQRGAIIHSPAHCLPANGWYIVDERLVPMPGREDGTLINRMEVAFGEQRKVVYYWYQGRGRILSDSLVSALYRSVDVALLNRSDEALIRFHTNASREDEESMSGFIAEVAPRLEPFLPGRSRAER
jgi:EpsI family protein